MSSQFQLLKQRKFRPYFLTQMFGPLNINAFKTAFITLLTFKSDLADASLLVTALPAIFILPFFLFSATCGQLADRYDRAQLIRFSKQFEFAIAVLASIGFLISSFWLLVAALFLSGVQTTQFAPLKYAYLPQHLSEQELTGGNGLVEASTFVSILLGQVIGAWLVSTGHLWLVSLTLLLLAGAGWLSAQSIPASPAPDCELKIDWNPVTATISILQVARNDKVLWGVLLAISWFWLYGATMLAQLPLYTKNVLGGDEPIYIFLLCVFSVGVGLGSLICEKLSRGHVEPGLIILGALLMALPGFDLYIATPEKSLAYEGTVLSFLTLGTHWRMLIDIALIGAGGGIYVVPLYALMQFRCTPRYTARIIAGSSIMNAGFMFLSSLICVALLKAGLSTPQLFLILAISTALVLIILLFKMQGLASNFIYWLRGQPINISSKKSIKSLENN